MTIKIAIKEGVITNPVTMAGTTIAGAEEEVTETIVVAVGVEEMVTAMIEGINLIIEEGEVVAEEEEGAHLLQIDLITRQLLRV